MQRLFQMVMGLTLTVLILQLPWAAWAKDPMQLTLQPGTTLQGTTDNAKINKAEVPQTIKPDLVVSTINFSPGKPVEGDEITLWVFVLNKGMTQAGASGVRVKVGGESNPPVIPVPPLNPSQQFKYTRKVTFKRSGNFIVTITADAGNAVAESLESNNMKKTTISVKSKLPDLVISKINFSPANPKKGEKVTVWYFVKNVGQGKSLPCILGTTSSLNSYHIWHEERVPALDSGRAWRYEGLFRSSSKGHFKLKAVIDKQKKIDESNETNNEGLKDIKVN